MRSGRLSLVRRKGLVPLVLAALACPGVWAQQESPSRPPGNAATPALPPAQPLAEAAAGMASKDTSKETNDAAAAPASTSTAESIPRLGAGDLIEVDVYNVPELTTKARVGNSGDVYLPLIDYVHIGDLTVEEAQALLEKKYEDGGFVRSPHVTIFLSESASQGVTIIGEVTKPGIYPDLGDRKLYDMISAAGGFTATSGRKIGIIRRNQPTITVNLPRNLADDLQGNVDIQPGDTISVPKAPIIYVVGDVGRPSGLLVDNGTLTVLQAIALAGGTNRTAKTNGVRIVRKGPNGMTETQVPLKKMLEAKAPDMTLQPDDILFVPVSGGRVLAGRTFEAAMSAATAVTIYTVHP